MISESDNNNRPGDYARPEGCARCGAPGNPHLWHVGKLRLCSTCRELQGQADAREATELRRAYKAGQRDENTVRRLMLLQGRSATQAFIRAVTRGRK